MAGDELIQIHMYTCEGTVTTLSLAVNFGIVKNVRKLDMITKVVYIIVPYFYVVAQPNYIRVWYDTIHNLYYGT